MYLINTIKGIINSLKTFNIISKQNNITSIYNPLQIDVGKFGLTRFMNTSAKIIDKINNEILEKKGVLLFKLDFLIGNNVEIHFEVLNKRILNFIPTVTALEHMLEYNYNFDKVIYLIEIDNYRMEKFSNGKLVIFIKLEDFVKYLVEVRENDYQNVYYSLKDTVIISQDYNWDVIVKELCGNGLIVRAVSK